MVTMATETQRLNLFNGWKVDEKMAQILSKALPSLSNLQSLETVFLEGTPIPENSYHILMAEDSLIAHLSLRNNHIGEDGARLISLALCKSLLSLNLAFNAVGNVGATYLAQGLRLNRTLLYLSLANNHIGDAGAAQLAQVFGPFALTHEEIVERRRELKKKEQLRNSFPPDCETFVKLQELMSLKDPLKRTTSAQVDAEQGQAA
ncbi:leucine-rich repeat-containing protein 71 isoform X2 [Silurus meridionalis]|nr:leucine-rich repeat-containing protein 71 isoform X2 [Silurus meridionalis]